MILVFTKKKMVGNLTCGKIIYIQKRNTKQGYFLYELLQIQQVRVTTIYLLCYNTVRVKSYRLHKQGAEEEKRTEFVSVNSKFRSLTDCAWIEGEFNYLLAISDDMISGGVIQRSKPMPPLTKLKTMKNCFCMIKKMSICNN